MAHGSTYRMLACDYDRTLADEGVISTTTENALRLVKKTGLYLGMVTGREIGDLLSVCPQIDLFDIVVAENGAMIYWPAERRPEGLVDPPDPAFLDELTGGGVPYVRGTIIIAVHEIYKDRVARVLEETGANVWPIFNRDSLMLLPRGVDKGSGLAAAAQRMGLTLAQIIGIGDAENDRPFLKAAGFSVAVANALDSLKAQADLVTSQPNGNGVAEFIREHVVETSDGGFLFKQPVSRIR